MNHERLGPRAANHRRARKTDKILTASRLRRCDIARRVGITPSYLARLLRSKSNPISPAMQHKIERAVLELMHETRNCTLNLCLIRVEEEMG